MSLYLQGGSRYRPNKDRSVYDMLQNNYNAFAVVLQDNQNSFRLTTTPITLPVRRVPYFSEIALF